jgi:type 1 glutamine amidotransferase
MIKYLFILIYGLSLFIISTNMLADTPVPVPTPKPETPKPETPKPETPKPETPKPETPKPETPKPETPKPETPKPETPKPETPKPETPKPETPKPETPKPETPKPETPKPETPKPETPKPETPKPETPKPETPKPETPKPETPKPETPKPETPKPETPKPETPKPETPKPVYNPYLRVVPEKALLQSDKDLITLALPTQPIVKPKQPRKLLIFDLNVDFEGHRSIVCANFAFTQMGLRTKAFEVVVSHEPADFKAEHLQKFDAVVFNNTVGNLFEDNQLRHDFEEYVKNGGGLLALHSAAAAFICYGGDKIGQDDWAVFGEMIGARGMVHRETDELVFVKVEAPEHPLTQFFPKEGFWYRDEIPRFVEQYSRQKQQILLSVDNAPSNLHRLPFGELKERADEDYALLWVKQYGQGRCCYIAFGHNPRVFWDTAMLKLHLAAAQFVLGDLDSSLPQ